MKRKDVCSKIVSSRLVQMANADASDAMQLLWAVHLHVHWVQWVVRIAGKLPNATTLCYDSADRDREFVKRMFSAF